MRGLSEETLIKSQDFNLATNNEVRQLSWYVSGDLVGTRIPFSSNKVTTEAKWESVLLLPPNSNEVALVRPVSQEAC